MLKLLKFVSIYMIFFTAAEVYAQQVESQNIRIYKEQKDTHRVYGIAWNFVESSTPHILTHIGISANKITSDRPLEHADRHTIFPVYIYGTLSLNTAISPYVELGIDLGDYFFDKSHEGETDRTDIYFAAGLKTSFSKSVNFLLYAKSYHLRFLEIDDPLLKETTIDTLGLGISINF